MKAVLIEWVGGIKNLPSWWKKGEADISMEQILELYNTGNNVMLRHCGDPESMIVAVDNQGFGQR